MGRLRGVAGYAIAVVVAGCFLVIAGVALSLRENTDPDTKVLQGGDVFVLMEAERYTGPVAGTGISGRLDLVGEHCVGLAGQGEGVLIVFPPETSIRGADADLVIEVDGIELRLGDRFDAGTRGSGSAPLSAYGDLVDQVPEPCRNLEAVDVSELARSD